MSLVRRLIAAAVLASGSAFFAEMPSGSGHECVRRQTSHGPPCHTDHGPPPHDSGSLSERGTGMSRRPVRFTLTDFDDLARIDSGHWSNGHSRFGHCTPWTTTRMHEEPTVMLRHAV